MDLPVRMVTRAMMAQTEIQELISPKMDLGE